MSSKTNREIDERVVQMTFNNEEFEKGVKSSLSTLEKLKRALDFKHRPTGLEDFGKAVGSIEQNLAPIAKDVDHIANRFTALGIIGDQVLRNLTNKVVNFGEKLVKSATIEPLTSGFSEYETQMKSVQTILANTGMEGQKGVDKVNKALDELNKYADKTIYNFTEMTNNIGRFTAAGVKLEPAVSAIKGTANLAAMSGSTSEQAARAMYNLSQALSTGTLKLMDWNSVVNAGMGGQVFQDALIQAAAAMDGMGDKVDEWKAKHVDAFGSFRDSLSKGWITSDVLSEALHNFTYDVEEGTEKYEEALKELISKGYTEKAAKDILKMSKQATEAATKVRTFTQLIDTLKEALGSGWAQSWRIIFGDFYEATELWTGISEALGGFIDSISEARNNALGIWKGFDVGGRLDLLEAMKELVYDIALIIKPIADAFHDVFGELNAEGLQSATIAFKNFVKQLHPSVEGFNSIKKIATTVFSIIKNGITIATRGISAILTVGQPLLYLADTLLIAFSDLLDAVVHNTVVERMITVLQTIARFISAVVTVGIVGLIKGIYAVGAAIRAVKMDGFVSTVIGLGAAFADWVKNLKPVKKAMEFFKNLSNGAGNAIEGLVNVLSNGLGYLAGLADYIYRLPMVQYAIQGIANIAKVLWSVLVGVKDIVVGIFDSIKGLDLTQFTNPLEFIKALVMAVINNVVNGINRAGDAIAAKFPLFNTLRSMVTSVVEAFKNGITVLKDFFISLKDNGINFEGGESGLRSIIDAIKNFIAVIDPAKMGALAITMVMLSMCLTFVRIGNLMAKTVQSFNGLLTTIKTAISGFVNTQSNKIIQAAEAVLMVAAAIAIIAGIPPTDLQHAVQAILAIVGLIGVLQIALEHFRKVPNITGSGSVTENITNLGGVALMILEIEGALAIMVATLKEIKTLDLNGIETNIIAVMGLFVTMTVIAMGLDRFKVGFSKGTVGILVLTAAIWSLVAALKQLEGLSKGRITASLQGLIPLMGMLTAISFAAKGIGLTTGLGLILTARAIEYLLPTIQRIYDAFAETVHIEDVLQLIEKYKDGFTALTSAIFILTALVGVFGKGFKDFGIGVLALAGSILVVAYALERLCDITKNKNINNGFAALVGIFAMIGIWLVIAAFIPEKSAILKVAVSIGLMAATILIINVALSQLASMTWDKNTLIAAGILGCIMALMAVMEYVAGKAGEAKGAFGVMASMMLGLTVVIAELIALSYINWKDLVMPLISVGTILLLMANILKTATGVTHYNNQGVAAMIAVVVAMGIMMQALSDLSMKDSKGVITAGVSMSLVLLAMGSMLKSLAKFEGVSGTSTWQKSLTTIGILATVIGALWVIAESIKMLAEYNFKAIISAAAGISVVLAVVGALVVYISKSAPEWQKGLGALGVLLGVCLAIAGVTASLYFLKDIDGDQLLKSAISVVGSLIGIALVVKLFSGLNMGMLEGVLAGIAAIALIIVSIFALVIGIQGLFDSVKSDFGLDLWQLIKDFAQNVGDAIGTFVGALSGAATSGLETVGENLSKFGIAAKAFFEATSGINIDSVKGVLYLALAMGVLTASSFIDAIVSFLTLGNSSLTKFAEGMPILGKALVGYNEAINKVDANGKKPDFSGLEESAAALKTLIETISEIPTEGGLLGAIMGDINITSFSSGLLNLGMGIRLYANEVAKVGDWSVVDPSLTALTKIVNIARSIPTEGGFLNYIFGDSDIGDFGGKLLKVAWGIRGYAEIMRSCTQEDFTKMSNSMTALKSVVDVAKQIPNAGGWLGAVFGDNNIDEFGDKLGKFGQTFSKFSIDIAATDTHAVNRNAKALSNFVDSLLRVEELNLYTFDEIIPNIQHSIESMLQGIVASVGDNLDIVEEAMQKLADAIVKKASGSNGKMRGVGRDYADRIGKGLSSQGSIDKLSENVETLIGNAFEKAKENLNKTAYNSGAEIGQEFVNGVIGPDGIDPDVNPGPNEPSNKLLDDIVSLGTNTFQQAQEALSPVTEKVGSFLGDNLVQNFSIDGILDKVTSAGDTVMKVFNGDLTFTDLLSDITGGHDVWSSLGFGDIFKNFGEIPEGTDIEREITKGLGIDGLGDVGKSAGKSLKGVSDSANKAKDSLKTYNKYLKYSANVEAEFAKTTGAAMSVFTNETPINNAKVAIAALAEQIYADSQKVKDTIDDTATTAEDRAIAVMNAFNEDYEAIKSSVSDSLDIFKNFYSEATQPVKGSTIISNITSQLEGYNSMATKFQILASRGFPMDYIQELAEKGSEGFNELQSVLAFTNEETTKFIEVWTKYKTLGDDIATNIMSAKATKLAVDQLRQASAGAKKYNKEVKELYLQYKKMYKELQAKGDDPFGNEELIKTYNELNDIVAKTGTDLKALDESLAEHSAESAAAALELIEKYTQAESVLDKYNTTFSSTKETVRSLIDEQLNTFETFTKKTSISADDMIDILTSQTKGIAQWSKELSTLSGRGLSQAILDDLAKLGPEGYEKVHAFYKMSDEQLDKANELYSQKLAISDKASRMVATSFANTAAGGIDTYKQALEDAAENKQAFENIINKLSTNIASDINEMTSAQIIAGGEDIGKKLTQSIADGATGTKSTATNASSGVAKASTDAASETIKEEGEKTINPASTGVVKGAAKVTANTIKEEGEKTINPAVEEVGNNAISIAKKKQSELQDILTALDREDSRRVVKSNYNDDYIPLEKSAKATTNELKKANKAAEESSGTVGGLINKMAGVDYSKEMTQWTDSALLIAQLDGKITYKQFQREVERRNAIEKEIGMSYGEGLAKGLIDSKGNVIKAAREVARDMNKATASEVKVNSPSKEAEYIGEMYGIGLALGIKNTYSQLYSILQDYLKVILDTTNKTTKAVNKVGNVDINARPIVHNDDGTYSTTSTAYQERWKGDDETGHYIIGHFATIKQNGERLSDEELNDYIDKVLGSDDPFGTDASMENLLYAIVDKVKSGEYINDTNINKAFEEAEAWDEQMHELQDSMYRDQASMSYNGGFDTAFNFARGIIDGIVSMGNNAQAAAIQAATTVAQMVQSALMQASLTTDENYDLTHPVISPVIDFSSAQNGFNVLGNMFGTSPFDIGFTPQLNPVNIDDRMNGMVTAINNNRYDDTKVVQELSGLRNDVNNLNEKVGNLQVVMDSGQLVGSIGPKMDQELGNIYRRKNRG